MRHGMIMHGPVPGNGYGAGAKGQPFDEGSETVGEDERYQKGEKRQKHR